MPVHHPRTMLAPTTFDFTRLFEDVIGKAISERREVVKHLGPGIVVFEIDGVGGGTWTLDLEMARVVPGAVGIPDTVVIVDTENFHNLIGGKASSASLITGRKLVIRGDRTVLGRLALLLRP